MNILEIAGHIVADPETRFTPGGQKVTNFRVGVNSKKAGKEETMWWKVTVWGDRFDKMMPYLKKGSAVIVVGEMSKPEMYTDKEGRPQISLDMTAEMIKFSPFGKPERSSQEQGASGYSQPSAGQSQSGQGGFDSGFGESSKSYTPSSKSSSNDDDMPF